MSARGVTFPVKLDTQRNVGGSFDLDFKIGSIKMGVYARWIFPKIGLERLRRFARYDWDGLEFVKRTEKSREVILTREVITLKLRTFNMMSHSECWVCVSTDDVIAQLLEQVPAAAPPDNGEYIKGPVG